MGDCLLWAVKEKHPFFDNFIPRLSLCINRDKNGLGYILGDFFTNLSGHPGLSPVLEAKHCRVNLSFLVA
jgi:hypothetical protein